MTVSLRPLFSDDVVWLDAWLGDIARSVDYTVDGQAVDASLLLKRARTGAHVYVIERGERAGVIVCAPGGRSRREAIIEFVGAPPAQARRGSAMSGAAALERELAARGVRTLYAPAPERHGIAIYFWIRLGYRPLLRDDWPCARDGVAWLRRDIS